MVGCVLAGGQGSRIGGDKALVELRGRPLLRWVLAALDPIVDRTVVVAKAATRLPDDVERWDEPDEPAHPLTGIVTALERARDDVLVVAVDLPLLRAHDLQRLVLGGTGVRWAPGDPLCAVYPAEALDRLKDAPPDVPLRLLVRSLDPVAVAIDPMRLMNVNTAEDLARAERVLAAEAG